MEYTDIGVKITLLTLFEGPDQLENAKEAFKWVMEDVEVVKPEGATVTKLEPVQ